eukprot:snap_masked-scaffold_4-processed-gene-17.47-mRNA-1 protein AED:1.00 eAED:1.00 QI:0/-1/0/0/-1/1/1/0/249
MSALQDLRIEVFTYNVVAPRNGNMKNPLTATRLDVILDVEFLELTNVLQQKINTSIDHVFCLQGVNKAWAIELTAFFVLNGYTGFGDESSSSLGVYIAYPNKFKEIGKGSMRISETVDCPDRQEQYAGYSKFNPKQTLKDVMRTRNKYIGGLWVKLYSPEAKKEFFIATSHIQPDERERLKDSPSSLILNDLQKKVGNASLSLAGDFSINPEKRPTNTHETSGCWDHTRLVSQISQPESDSRLYIVLCR